MLISIFQLIHHTLNHGKAKERAVLPWKCGMLKKYP